MLGGSGLSGHGCGACAHIRQSTKQVRQCNRHVRQLTEHVRQLTYRKGAVYRGDGRAVFALPSHRGHSESITAGLCCVIDSGLWERYRESTRCSMDTFPESCVTKNTSRAFAVKVVRKRLPVSPFSRLDLYHRFRTDAFYDLYNLLKVRKTGKQEVVFGQPLPQTL